MHHFYELWNAKLYAKQISLHSHQRKYIELSKKESYLEYHKLIYHYLYTNVRYIWKVPEKFMGFLRVLFFIGQNSNTSHDSKMFYVFR